MNKFLFIFTLMFLCGCATTTELHAQQAESAKLQTELLSLQKQVSSEHPCWQSIENAAITTKQVVSDAYTLAQPTVSSAYETAKPVVVKAATDAYDASKPVVIQAAKDAEAWAEKKYHDQTATH